MILEKNRYLIKIKVNCGQFLGGKEEDAFIELREPTMPETIALNDTMKASGFTQAFQDLLPSIIVGHNLNESEAVPCKTEAVAEVVLSKTQLFACLLNAYYEKVILFISPSTPEATESKATEGEKTGS